MNREIKFRAWDKRNKEMVGVETIDFNEDGSIEEINTSTYCWSDNRDGMTGLINIVLLQFTGLKDKNGKEIYRGDVIEVHDGYERGAVEFRKGAFFLANTDKQIGNFITDTVQIIGNIYENPELLK